MQPLVSIIIPVYNSAKFVAETLDSVIDQTYINWECILIDDNSSDNSKEVLIPYLEEYPDKIKLYTNIGKGACSARNLGLDICRGEFIKFLDSDDALFNNTVLEKQIEFYNHEQFDIVYGTEYYYQDEFTENKLVKMRGKLINGPTDFYDNFPITSNFLISKKKLGELRWNEQLGSGQEFFLLYQGLARGMTFGYQDLVTSKIRVHNSIHRISNKSNETHIAQLLQLIEHMSKEIELLHISDTVFLKQYKKQLLLSSYQAIKLKNNNALKTIRKEISKFQSISPDSFKLSIIYRMDVFNPILGYWIHKIFMRLGIRFD